MTEPRPCLCGHTPQLVFWEQDRDLHPTILHARYSCGTQGHIVAAPWFDLGLTGTRENPQMAAGAAELWNSFLRTNHDQR